VAAPLFPGFRGCGTDLSKGCPDYRRLVDSVVLGLMGNFKLFVVHCGFYDTDLLDGIYESHVNFVIAAESFEDARAKVKLEPEFQKKRMHVDGLQLVDAIKGYRVTLTHDATLEEQSVITSNCHRDLAPKKQLEQG
jgi:hypothetical protein